MTGIIDNIFDADGIIKKMKNDYIPRPSQIEAAKQLESALLTKKHGIIEGSTGFGKTFAYLIP
jgi:Rad3-related DNA helicase